MATLIMLIVRAQNELPSPRRTGRLREQSQEPSMSCSLHEGDGSTQSFHSPARLDSEPSNRNPSERK
jgi:hypothetical protein